MHWLLPLITAAVFVTHKPQKKSIYTRKKKVSNHARRYREYRTCASDRYRPKSTRESLSSSLSILLSPSCAQQISICVPCMYMYIYIYIYIINKKIIQLIFVDRVIHTLCVFVQEGSLTSSSSILLSPCFMRVFK
jgi:hypothetical protein